MQVDKSIDWSTEESLRKIISDARFAAKAPSDAIERAYRLLVEDNNLKFPHLQWTAYQDTSYKWHVRVTNRQAEGR